MGDCLRRLTVDGPDLARRSVVDCMGLGGRHCTHVIHKHKAQGTRGTPSQVVSAPEASSPAALVVPAGHAMHAFPDTRSLAAQRIAVTRAVMHVTAAKGGPGHV